MALPKVILPTFELTLPSTGKQVKFRPFIMKEEKLLLMALEAGTGVAILEAVHNVVQECTFGTIDTKTSPLFDVQYAFLQIRAKSVGEESDFVITCGNCQKVTPTTINIAKINVDRIEGHTNKIILSPTLTILMKYPVLEHLTILKNFENANEIYGIIAECVDKFYTGDEVTDAKDEPKEAIVNFLDTLPVAQFNKLREFFATMPVLRYEHKFTCDKCQVPNVLNLEGIESFFV